MTVRYTAERVNEGPGRYDHGFEAEVFYQPPRGPRERICAANWLEANALALVLNLQQKKISED